MCNRSIRNILLIALLAWMTLAQVGCDEEQKHAMLTFFFDGVPPIDPNVVEVDGQRRRLGALDDEIQTGPVQAGSNHEPRKDCTNCHDRSASGFFNQQVKLLTPVPKLCFDCHTKDSKPPKQPVFATKVHGPVAVGQCLMCHNPHRSKYEALLLDPQPELCYACHDKNDIKTIRGHATRLGSRCTDCHEPHASVENHLLKGDWRSHIR